MTRPSIQRAVADANITASMWNDNFDAILDYSEEIILDCADKNLSNLTATGKDYFVTKDTSQTISGDKTFSGATTLSGTTTISGTTTVSGATTFSGDVTLPSATQTTLIGNVMPDYEAGVNKNINTSYQAECDGWLIIQGYTGSPKGRTLYIGNSSSYTENHTIGYTYCYSGGISETMTVPVLKNQYYYLWGNTEQNYMIFYPCKGVS